MLSMLSHVQVENFKVKFSELMCCCLLIFSMLPVCHSSSTCTICADNNDGALSLSLMMMLMWRCNSEGDTLAHCLIPQVQECSGLRLVFQTQQNLATTTKQDQSLMVAHLVGVSHDQLSMELVRLCSELVFLLLLTTC